MEGAPSYGSFLGAASKRGWGNLTKLLSWQPGSPERNFESSLFQMIPGIGQLYQAFTVATGKDPIAGKSPTKGERIFSGVMLGIGAVAHLSPGEGGGTGVTRGSSNPNEYIQIFRGTSHGGELDVLAESGHVLSDAGRTAYIEGRYSGQSIQDALKSAMVASKDAHQQQLRTWYGDLNAYAQAHATFGTEINIFGPRSLMSWTTDASRAAYFAGKSGTVISTIVKRSQVIFQTLPGSTEEEVLIMFGIKVR